MKERMKIMTACFIVMAVGIFMFTFTVIGLFLLCAGHAVTMELAGLILLMSVLDSAAIMGCSELARLFKEWRRTQMDRGY